MKKGRIFDIFEGLLDKGEKPKIISIRKYVCYILGTECSTYF